MNKTPLFSFSLTIAIGLSILIVLIIFHIIFNISIQDSENDLRNWVSLTIESGIGIFIAMMVLHYDKSQQKKSDLQQKTMEQILRDTKIQQDKISELVLDIKKIEEGQQKIIEEQEQTRKLRQISTYHEMLSYLDLMLFEIAR